MADVGTLLSAAVATGAAIPRAKGIYTFAVNGTFGGCTVALEMMGPDGSNYIAIDDTAFTAAGAINVELPSGKYRASITGGAAMSISATLKEAGWQ